MTNPAVEAFREDEEQLKELLKYDEAANAFGEKGRNQIHEAIDVMSSHIEQLIEQNGEGEVKVAEQQEEVVVRTSRVILNQVTFGEVDKWLHDFTVAYVDFCQKWNRKILQSNTLETPLAASKRVVSGQETMKDARETLKKLIDKAEAVLDRDPEALALSEAYIERIRSRGGGNDDTCKGR